MHKFYLRVCRFVLPMACLLFQSGRAQAVQLQEPVHTMQKKQADTLHLLYGDRPAAENIQSVSTLGTGALTSTPAALYTYALTGRMTGLVTNQTGGWPLREGLFPPDVNSHLLPLDQRYQMMVGRHGGPTDNAEIMASLRGMGPAPLVDGVQRDISSIAPENIESITLLKDALSTILLGQRSSRGVLLVTTKRALPGGPHVSFTAQTGVQTPVGLPKTLPADQFAWLYNEALQNDGLEAAYTAEDFNAYRSGSSPFTHPNINWYDYLLKDQAPISRYNLGIGGGGAVARYSVSLDYLNRQGHFRETSFDNPYETNVSINRYVLNTNVDVNVNQNFNVALGIFDSIRDRSEEHPSELQSLMRISYDV